MIYARHPPEPNVHHDSSSGCFPRRGARGRRPSAAVGGALRPAGLRQATASLVQRAAHGLRCQSATLRRNRSLARRIDRGRHTGLQVPAASLRLRQAKRRERRRSEPGAGGDGQHLSARHPDEPNRRHATAAILGADADARLGHDRVVDRRAGHQPPGREPTMTARQGEGEGEPIQWPQ